MWPIWQRATFVRCRRHIRCCTFLAYVDSDAVGCKTIIVHDFNEYLLVLLMHALIEYVLDMYAQLFWNVNT